MKKVIICFMILMLNACCLRSPQSQFYVMDSQNLSPISNQKLNIAVTKVKVPEMLDKPQMVVYDKGSSQVQILEFHRWAEAFPNILQSVLTNDLIAYLPESFVERTYFDSITAKYNVNVEINQIAAYQGDKVILSAWWNIKNQNGKVLKRKQHNYTAPVNGDSVADLVKAETAAIHQMSREIADTLTKLH